MGVCRELDYFGRYVWLVRHYRVQMRGITRDPKNCIRWRVVNLNTFNLEPIPEREGRWFKITKEMAVAALPILRGRRRKLFLYMHPDTTNKKWWSGAPTPKFMPEEKAVLTNQPEAYDPNTIKVARFVCEMRNLVTKSGNLTYEGREVFKLLDTSTSLVAE